MRLFKSTANLAAIAYVGLTTAAPIAIINNKTASNPSNKKNNSQLVSVHGGLRFIPQTTRIPAQENSRVQQPSGPSLGKR